MSKFLQVIVGAVEIAFGVYLQVVTFGASTPLTQFLISMGVGSVLGGLGSMMSGGSGLHGVTGAMRNPLAYEVVCYGQSRLGGTSVYIPRLGSVTHPVQHGRQ